MLLYYDVIDGDVNKFDEEANESHDSKANGCSKSDLLKFCKQNEKISFTKAVYQILWRILLELFQNRNTQNKWYLCSFGTYSIFRMKEI